MYAIPEEVTPTIAEVHAPFGYHITHSPELSGGVNQCPDSPSQRLRRLAMMRIIREIPQLPGPVSGCTLHVLTSQDVQEDNSCPRPLQQSHFCEDPHHSTVLLYLSNSHSTVIYHSQASCIHDSSSTSLLHVLTARYSTGTRIVDIVNSNHKFSEKMENVRHNFWKICRNNKHY